VTGGLVNLARRPFANTRPIRRAAILLWVLAVGLAALVGWLYWRSLFGIEGQKEERARVERQIGEERRRLAAAESALATMDLARQNTETAYLNARFGERNFPWSELFVHLSEVLPRKVRLFSLAPQTGEARGRTTASRRPHTSSGPVFLSLTGAAATDEDLTQLLDGMFKSPWFSQPTLPREQRQNGVIQFALTVAYRPAGRATVLLPEPTPTPAVRAPRPAAPARPTAPRPRTGEDL
jgi:Tfp pilus assembly protein PilN